MGQLSCGNEHILVLAQMADNIFSRYVRRRLDAGHAGQSLCLFGVDGENPRPGVFASEQAACQHSFHIKVVGILAGS